MNIFYKQIVTNDGAERFFLSSKIIYFMLPGFADRTAAVVYLMLPKTLWHEEVSQSVIVGFVKLFEIFYAGTASLDLTN